jgi:hypothetical protein
MKKFFKTIRLVYIVFGIIILILIVGRLLLPGIVRNYVNRKLNELPGYSGHVQDIDIALIRGAYVIKQLELKKKTDPAKYPFLHIDRADLSLEWGALFKGRLVGKVALDRPVVYILATESISKEPSKDSWTATVKALMPMRINRLQVNNGRFAYLDFGNKPNVNLHIDQMQLTALNLANVQKSGEHLPSTVNVSGIAIGDGHLKAGMKVNVLKDIPDFDLSLELTHVNLLSLNSFMEANAKFDIERGNLDVFSKLKLQNSEMEGYIKPFINNLKVLDVKKDIKKKGGPLRVVKKAIVGLFAKAVTNPKTKKIATIVPINGNIKDPETSGWVTFLNVLKNAFVKAFHESLQNELQSKDTGEKTK